MTGRRDFLGGSFAAGVCALSGGCRVFTGCADDFDDSLAVLLADPHVCDDAEESRWAYTCDELDKRIAEILSMRPLPRNVVVFGDLVLDTGKSRDYATARRKLKLLTDAGVRLTLGVGNHDRRLPFWDAFPETKASPVDGKVVSVLRMRHCDLILLDSLVGKAGEEPGTAGGELDDAQQEWLADFLPKQTRPTLVGAHHSAQELKVGGRSIVSLLKESPSVVGWINGHDHRWTKRPLTSWGSKFQDTIRGLTLPSAGLWGDIGSVELRMRPDGARAVLRETGYWFNDRLHPNEREPDVWKAIVAENQGQHCYFPFSRMMRRS